MILGVQRGGGGGHLSLGTMERGKSHGGHLSLGKMILSVEPGRLGGGGGGEVICLYEQ